MESREYSKYLKDTYPTIVEDPRCDISVDEGWHKLVETLVQDLLSLPDLTCKVAQIKEKFGGLRFYHDGIGGSDRTKRIANALISQAERDSSYICVNCGERGYVRNDLGWVLPLCKTHYEEVPEVKKRVVKQAIVIDETGVSLINAEE